MYGGGYITINFGPSPLLGGGERSNKIFSLLEQARKSNKPVLAFMRSVYDDGTAFGDIITNWLSYTYYEGRRQDEEAVYFLTFTYVDDKNELQTKKYWIKKEE